MMNLIICPSWRREEEDRQSWEKIMRVEEEAKWRNERTRKRRERR